MSLSHTLQDIAHNIEIEPAEFCISHSRFSVIKMPNNTVSILKSLPSKIQDNYFKFELHKFIHSIYFEGSFVIEVNQDIKTREQALQTIASREIDWEFYKKLDNNNKGKGFFHPLFRVLKQEADGSLAAEFDGGIIHIQRERHLSLDQQSATVNDRIALWLPSSFINRRRYRANGELTGDFASNKNEKGAFAYFNFNPETAVYAMKLITERLNFNKVPFVFEVLHNPLNYSRYESGILRFKTKHYETFILPILQTIYAKNKFHFQAQVPLFTKRLAPGIGLSEHPYSQLKFNPQQDFGENRCEIVANALIEAHQNRDESPEARMKYIVQHFERLGIDLERPYLNPNSEDIYTPLE